MKLNPVSIFVNTLKAAKFWFSLFLIMVLVSALQPYLIIQAIKKRDHVVIMDGAGVFHRAPLLTEHEATDIFEELAERALDALFLKNPEGYDRMKLQKQLFLPGAMKTIDKIRQIEDPFFKEYAIHQKWELDGMQIKYPTATTTHVMVKGQLVRNGNVNKSDYFHEGLDFQVLLTFSPNPNMAQNTRLPYAVSKLKYKVTEQND